MAPCWTAVDTVAVPQREPYLPSSVAPELGFTGLHSSLISPLRFFQCCCWGALKSPWSVSFHQDCVKRDCHIPALWQAVQVIQNCVGWLYCHLTLQIDIQFSACCCPPRGFGVFPCFVLFYCFANIPFSLSVCILDYFSPDEPGCIFVGWSPFHFLPYFWLTSSGSVEFHHPHWNSTRLLVCPPQIDLYVLLLLDPWS